MSGLVEDLRVFMESGGAVLWLIAAATFCLWALMAERVLYLYFWFPKVSSERIAQWERRADKRSWTGKKVRQKIVNEVALQLGQGLGMIKTIIGLCPLFGLLGTVTGMIHLFDVMAAVGTGNARQMAAGISMATMPTMAGMVAALSGVYLSWLIEQKVSREKSLFQDHLERA